MKRQQDDDEWSRLPPSKPRYNDDDEFGIDGVPDPPAFFKKSAAITIPEFLFKFTPEEIKKIDTFVQKHKALLKLPPPTKICIFEDAYMLREFIRNRESISKSKKSLDPICKRLEGILRRASITIRERLTKKYVKTSTKEIMEAIDQNRHLIFDKNDRSRRNNPAFGVSPVKIEGHSPLKMEGHVDRHHHENIKVDYKMEYREDDLYFDSETQSEAHKDRYQPSPIKKEEKSPIKKKKKKEKPVTKEKEDHHPNHQHRQEHHSPREDHHYHPRQEEDTRLRQEVRPKNGSIYRYGTKPIQKRIYIHANRRTHTFKTIPEQRLEEVLKQIEQNRNPPLPPQPPPPPPSFQDHQFRYDSPIHPKKDESDISSNQSYKSITKSIKESMIPPIDPPRPMRTFLDDGIKDQLEAKVLTSVSYNQDSLQIIKRDPSKRAQHVWTQEQDKLLGNFQMYRYEVADELKCLLRYKSFTKIKERCIFLDISLSAEEEEFFKQLAEEVRQDAIKRAS